MIFGHIGDYAFVLDVIAKRRKSQADLMSIVQANVPGTSKRNCDELVDVLGFVEMSLATGTPIHRLPRFRPWITVAVPSETELYRHISFLHKRHVERVKRVLQHRDIPIIFDGTSDNKEIFTVIARFVDSQKVPRHILIRLGLYATAWNNMHLCAVLNRILFLQGMNESCASYALQPSQLKFVTCDGGSINLPGLLRLKGATASTFETLPCLDHFLDLCGKKVDPDLMACFLEHVSALFKVLWARTLFRNFSDSLSDYPTSVPTSPSKTRWWSKLRLIKWCLSHHDTLTSFLQCDFSEWSTPSVHFLRLREIVSKPIEYATTLVQLAAVFDTFEVFVHASDRLEGDSLLCLWAYDELTILETHVLGTTPTPNLLKLVQELQEKKHQTSIWCQKHFFRLDELWLADCAALQRLLSGRAK
jgi:hypothetical protein